MQLMPQYFIKKYAFKFGMWPSVHKAGECRRVGVRAESSCLIFTAQKYAVMLGKFHKRLL